MLRELNWIGSSLADLKRFPKTVQKSVGVALFRIQMGQTPAEVKPLKGVSGVFEIRTDHDTDTFRTVYATKIGTKIYVLHAFKKKSKRGIATPKAEVELIAARLKMAKVIARKDKT